MVLRGLEGDQGTSLNTALENLSEACLGTSWPGRLAGNGKPKIAPENARGGAFPVLFLHGHLRRHPREHPDFGEHPASILGSYAVLGVSHFRLCQKNPHTHKNKIGTSPLPPNPTPPPQNEKLYASMGMEIFPAERTKKFQATIKSTQPFPALELRAEKLRTWGFCWVSTAPLDMVIWSSQTQSFQTRSDAETQKPAKDHKWAQNPKDPAVLQTLQP